MSMMSVLAVLRKKQLELRYFADMYPRDPDISNRSTSRSLLVADSLAF